MKFGHVPPGLAPIRKPDDQFNKEDTMLPIRKILCPTDFSEPSLKGVATAEEMAKHFGAELLLVTVVAPIHPAVAAESAGYMREEFEKEMMRNATESLKQIVAEKIAADINKRQFVVYGSPADEIVALAKKEGVDLLVIATHGWTGWRRFVFGSVAEKVIRLATCPVLTVTGPAAD
jgi:nucleotide-binding universal stress UspA family protein